MYSPRLLSGLIALIGVVIWLGPASSNAAPSAGGSAIPIGTTLGPNSASASVALATEGDFAGLVDIGGHSLYLECRGQGSPTVLLEAGYRSDGNTWSVDFVQPEAPRTMVLPGVAAFSRVCAYDRPRPPGSQRSRASAPHRPRRCRQPARAAAGDGRPGSPRACRPLVGRPAHPALQQHVPNEVVGLVLVDALPETIRTLHTPAQWTA